MRAAFNFDGSRTNLTIIEVVGRDIHGWWKGPLILRASSSRQDIDLGDFRALIDFCKKYEGEPKELATALRTNNLLELEGTNANLFAALLVRNSDNKSRKGVEIACEGDKSFLGTDQFVAVDVPIAHPVYDDVNRDTSGFLAGFGPTMVSKMIDLPLLVSSRSLEVSFSVSKISCSKSFKLPSYSHVDLYLRTGSSPPR